MELKIKENIERTAGDLVCPAVSRYYIWYGELINFNASDIYGTFLNVFFICFLSVCTVDGNAGDGTKQGDCNHDDFCSADGTCNGRFRHLIV